MDRTLKGFSIATTIGMIIIVMMGVIVTNTDSANGCGSSWPLCYGQFIPHQANAKTWIELSHRIVSALLGIMVITLAVWSWLRLRNSLEIKILGSLSVFFIALQGVLGGAAVIWQQSSFALALHFGFSIISFASVLLLTIVIFEQLHYGKSYVPSLTRKLQIHLFSLAIYTYLVVYSGAFVRHSGSSAGCGTSWPLCNGKWIPSLPTPAGVQFIHRLAAAAVFFWLLFLFVQAARHNRKEKLFFRSIAAAFLLVSCQVAAGASVVLSGLDLPFLLFHAFFITCFFGVLCYLFMIALRAGKQRKKNRVGW